MKKYDIYEQINSFKKELAPKLHQKTANQLEKYTFYVNDDEAKDKAHFIGFLIEKGFLGNKFNTIIDLTFGSGNLTSHIILENDITYKQLIFNDINKNYTNQKIISLYENSEIVQKDILNNSEFLDIVADFVILNPQVSGDYEGDISKHENYESKLSETIDYFYNQGANLIFYGIEKNFNTFFKNKFFIRYIGNANQLYIVNKSFTKNECYELKEGKFEYNKDCISNNSVDNSNSDINMLISELDAMNLSPNISCISSNTNNKTAFKFSSEPKGKENWQKDFKYKNILLKGVPGTGKSETIKNIITDKLGMKELTDNVLRINIHSASSNSDLMQGISISTTNDNENVLYREKQGAILNHIFKAIYKPKQPFVLVLEEIQENSLNELIGDLIYLIEDNKRTIVDLDIPNNTEIVYDELFDKINEKSKENNKSLDYVELPSLVENSQNNTKMIVPDNLFIFCTSNYRDDKKVIEDNLLRRFDVIEIYPKYDSIYKSEDIPKFLEKLNDEILKQFKDEIHPDRYLIGHANWLDIKEEDNEDNQVLFYKALLKVIIEFKEIREIDFDSKVKPILENVFKDIKLISNKLEQYLKIFYNDDKLGLKSYKNIVDILQKKIYKSFL